MKFRYLAAAMVLYTVPAPQVLADAAPSEEKIQSAIQQGQAVSSRAGKYQGSRGGAR